MCYVLKEYAVYLGSGPTDIKKAPLNQTCFAQQCVAITGWKITYKLS